MFYVHFRTDGTSQWVHTMEHFEASQEWSKRQPGVRYDRCFEVETNSQTTANAVGDAVATLIAHGVEANARNVRSTARVREIRPFA